MEIEISKNDKKMAMTGSGILRSIQNDNANIDLLVRESIQNSLDATLPGSNSVKVEINISTFPAVKLCDHLDKFGKFLKKDITKYGNGFISISDKNTTGLDGEIYNEDPTKEGNFERLVYQIARPKEGVDAGGSWGYGKTVYYRLGIGLVFFYTRYLDNTTNSYKSRLAGCFVENDKNAKSILNGMTGKNQTGLAWFGKNDREGNSYPLVDNDEELFEMLEIFNIKAYEGNETGTTLIIPFVNTNELLNDIKQKREYVADSSVNYNYWKDDIEATFVNQIKCWYTARINNKFYNECTNKPMLIISVNGINVEIDDDEEPVYLALQDLYNTALASNYRKIYQSKFDVDCETIKYAKSDTNNLGSFAFKKFTSKEIRGKLGNCPKPNIYLNTSNDNQNSNKPIVTCARMPGLFLNYHSGDEWNTAEPTDLDEYVLGVFVLNSRANINPSHFSIEKYIRSCEEADHEDWKDKTYEGVNYRIASTIKKSVNNILKDKFKKKVEEEKRTITGMSQKMGQLFFPTRGYAKTGSPAHGGGGGNGGGGSSTSRTKRFKTGISITNYKDYSTTGLTVEFELQIKSNDIAKVMLYVDGTGGKIEPNGSNGWEKEFNSMYPISIKKLRIDEAIDLLHKTVLVNDLEISNQGNYSKDLKINFVSSKLYERYYQVDIENTTENNIKIVGELEIETTDSNLAMKVELGG